MLHMRVCFLLQGQRGSLPSASIMLRQPMQRFSQMQASDIDIYRNEIRKTKNEIVSQCSECQAKHWSSACMTDTLNGSLHGGA